MSLRKPCPECSHTTYHEILYPDGTRSGSCHRCGATAPRNHPDERPHKPTRPNTPEVESQGDLRVVTNGDSFRVQRRGWFSWKFTGGGHATYDEAVAWMARLRRINEWRPCSGKVMPDRPIPPPPEPRFMRDSESCPTTTPKPQIKTPALPHGRGCNCKP